MTVKQSAAMAVEQSAARTVGWRGDDRGADAVMTVELGPG